MRNIKVRWDKWIWFIPIYGCYAFIYYASFWWIVGNEKWQKKMRLTALGLGTYHGAIVFITYKLFIE